MDELEPVPNTPADRAEDYAREWEAWAEAIREFPQITNLGSPGTPEFDKTFDAALSLLAGGSTVEIDIDLVRQPPFAS